MTLNDLERRNSLILRFSLNSIALLVIYVTVVKDRPIMSVNIVCQFQSSTFGHNLPTLQLGLSAIAELLVCCDCESKTWILKAFLKNLKFGFLSFFKGFL